MTRPALRNTRKVFIYNRLRMASARISARSPPRWSVSGMH